jgi:hypothetical protein
MEKEIPDRRWFLGRFIEAADVVVTRWAPRWARLPVLGRPVGVWALLAVWISLPLAVVFTL